MVDERTDNLNKINYRNVFIVAMVLAVAGMLASVTFSMQLNTTRNTLALTEDQLNSAQNALTASNSILIKTQDQLATTNEYLIVTQNELNTTRNTLTATQSDLKSAQNKVSGLQSNVTGLQDNLTQARSQVAELQANMSRMSSSYSYVLNDPTYAAMESFLASDKTDQHQYILGTYVCWNYAADVIADAEKQNIRCAFVYVEFADSAHAVVAFNTTDKGLVYIEPQSDEVVQLKLGTRYYQSIIPKSGYHYTQPPYDDTVKLFDAIW